MIRVRGMHKRYRTGKIVTPVLHGIDLDIEAGEFLSIVGPSGSGKSTLLHAIGGLDRDYEGTIEVDDRDLRQMSDAELSDYRNRKVGFVFQAFNLLPHLTCAQNVALPAIFARGKGVLPHAEVLSRAKAALARVDLSEKVDAPPTTLSGGQRQRVAIARALFNEPQLMLCDEPTGNLDSKMGATIIELFRNLNTQDGITVVIVTHDPRISESTARTLRVEDGRIHEDGTQSCPKAEDVDEPQASEDPKADDPKADDPKADDPKPEADA